MNISKGVLIFSFLGFMFSTLVSGQGNERITMIYQETVCSPPWVRYDNDKQTLTNLLELFAKDSIRVYSVKITGKPYETTCAGCQCLTGRNFEVRIDPKDQLKLDENLFHQPWVWMEKYEFSCDWTMGLNDDEIGDSLINKGIRVQGLYCTGLSEKKDDCSKQSGRMLTLRVDKDDMDKARKEGFILNEGFKQY